MAFIHQITTSTCLHFGQLFVYKKQMTKTVDPISGIPTQKSIQRDEKHEQNGDSDSDVESADSPPLVLKYLGKNISQKTFTFH